MQVLITILAWLICLRHNLFEYTLITSAAGVYGLLICGDCLCGILKVLGIYGYGIGTNSCIQIWIRQLRVGLVDWRLCCTLFNRSANGLRVLRLLCNRHDWGLPIWLLRCKRFAGGLILVFKTILVSCERWIRKLSCRIDCRGLNQDIQCFILSWWNRLWFTNNLLLVYILGLALTGRFILFNILLH